MAALATGKGAYRPGEAENDTERNTFITLTHTLQIQIAILATPSE